MNYSKSMFKRLTSTLAPIFSTSANNINTECRMETSTSGGAMVLGKLPVPGRPTI